MIQTGFNAEGKEGGRGKKDGCSWQTYCQIFFVIKAIFCFQFFGINTLLARSAYGVAIAARACGRAIK